MKTIIIASIISFLFCYQCISQKWVYSSKGNAFDGKYKFAYVTGKGGEFPYNNPSFYINYFEKDYSLNIYIAGAGFSGCDGKVIYVNFDNSDQIYEYEVGEDNKNETWFFSVYAEKLDELFKLMKKHSVMNVRIKSDCNQNDLKFSLSGSSNAIDFVTKDFYEIKKMADEIEKELEADITDSTKTVEKEKSVEQAEKDLMKRFQNKPEKNKQDSAKRAEYMKNKIIVKTGFKGVEIYKSIKPFVKLQTLPAGVELVVFKYNEDYYEICQIKEHGEFRPVRKVGYISTTAALYVGEYKNE